jgi:hypothetical protein
MVLSCVIKTLQAAGSGYAAGKAALCQCGATGFGQNGVRKLAWAWRLRQNRMFHVKHFEVICPNAAARWLSRFFCSEVISAKVAS